MHRYVTCDTVHVSNVIPLNSTRCYFRMSKLKNKKKKNEINSLIAGTKEKTNENFGFNHPTPQTPFWSTKTPEPESMPRGIEKSRKVMERGWGELRLITKFGSWLVRRTVEGRPGSRDGNFIITLNRGKTDAGSSAKQVKGHRRNLRSGGPRWNALP